MIEIVELPELTVLGLHVEAPWEDLHKAVPAAWNQLFDTDTASDNFLEVSLDQDGDIFRELVGYLAAANTPVPPDLTRHIVPAGRYLRLVHNGTLSDIPSGFAQLQAYAVSKGLEATDIKLDFGYRRGLPNGPHELHVLLAADRPRLA
ncbi:MAG: GyrI-like domain-containing protein [Rhizobiaceae bacterium]|nr:GyrI-like domain-containing protein [Rhizobiaceae bacterium]